MGWHWLFQTRCGQIWDTVILGTNQTWCYHRTWGCPPQFYICSYESIWLQIYTNMMNFYLTVTSMSFRVYSYQNETPWVVIHYWSIYVYMYIYVCLYIHTCMHAYINYITLHCIASHSMTLHYFTCQCNSSTKQKKLVAIARRVR